MRGGVTTGVIVIGIIVTACVGSGTNETTTTRPSTTTTAPNQWNDEAFRHAVSYCQWYDDFGSCTGLVTKLRDEGQCSPEAVLLVVDRVEGISDDATTSENERDERYLETLKELQAKNDCLQYPLAEE